MLVLPLPSPLETRHQCFLGRVAVGRFTFSDRWDERVVRVSPAPVVGSFAVSCTRRVCATAVDVDVCGGWGRGRVRPGRLPPSRGLWAAAQRRWPLIGTCPGLSKFSRKWAF